MDNFEKQFEDLDVQTSVMEGAMSQTTATNIPQDSVDVLMRQAADEAGLELNMELPGPAEQTVGQSTQVWYGWIFHILAALCVAGQHRAG